MQRNKYKSNSPAKEKGRTDPPDRQNVGILWETSCNYLGNSEQNEQMKKASIRAGNQRLSY
jgi:hypothetical protein